MSHKGYPPAVLSNLSRASPKVPCEIEALRAGGGQAPGALHHIIARGIERKRIFTDAVDKDNFLNRLGKLLAQISS